MLSGPELAVLVPRVLSRVRAFAHRLPFVQEIEKISYDHPEVAWMIRILDSNGIWLRDELKEYIRENAEDSVYNWSYVLTPRRFRPLLPAVMPSGSYSELLGTPVRLLVVEVLETDDDQYDFMDKAQIGTMVHDCP